MTFDSKPAWKSWGLYSAIIAGAFSCTSAAYAQESGAIPPKVPVSATANAPQAGGPPPLPVLLGYADFMLTLERPWQAEKLYRLVLMQDPKNVVAQQGLADALRQQRVGFTSLVHSYYDSKDVQLFAYGGGPMIPTEKGKLTVTAGNGYYKNNNNKNNPRNPTSLLPTFPSAEDNFALNRQTYNVQYEPFWGKNMEHEGSAWVSWQTYDNVPDRLLYDFRYSKIIEPGRKKFTVGMGRKDSFYQNQLNQFLAPETYFMLQKKITFRDYYTSIDYPLSKKIDFSFNYRYFKYTDQNERHNIRATVMHRIMPTSPMKPMPVWRVGLDGITDLGRTFTFDYGIPLDFRALSVATDYAMLSRDMKYVLYASFPILEKNFAAPAGLVAYVSKTMGPDKRYEVFAKANILEARNLSTSLYDYVLGLNTRF